MMISLTNIKQNERLEHHFSKLLHNFPPPPTCIVNAIFTMEVNTSMHQLPILSKLIDPNNTILLQPWIILLWTKDHYGMGSSAHEMESVKEGFFYILINFPPKFI